MNNYKTATIIPAAGNGVRMKAGQNKAFIEVCGKPIIVHTLEALAHCSAVGLVYIVVRCGEVPYTQELLEKYRSGFAELDYVVLEGGAERQQSVYNALRVLPSEVEYVAVHDGARPFITAQIFAACLESAREHGAAVVATPSKDTVKTAVGDLVAHTLNRAELRCIQTPQIFEKQLLLTAYRTAEAQGYLGTDDASLVERLGHKVCLTEGDYRNIKLTTPEDLVVAAAYWGVQGGEQMIMPRVGQGYDVHRLVPGRKLILGGVEIPHSLGLLGHSDADVLLHAIKDALLGACALGDIGDHFPDTSAEFKDISSLLLLERVREIIAAAGYVPYNIDAIIIAEKPKVAPFKEQMRSNIAKALHIDPEQVNLKATTTEQLGFTGRQEGIAAQAIASVIKK